MKNSSQKIRSYSFSNKYKSIALLAASATLCILPFIIHQTVFVGHDVKFHLFQSAQFYKAISSGSLIPKWALDANNGYGSANFLFYSPLSYYIVAIFHFFIPSLIISIIAAIWSSFFLSGISMFLMIKKFAGRSTGLLCAVLYQIFPFHLFDLYLRATLGELFAFVWFPLIFAYLDELLHSEKKHSAFFGLSLSYAGLVLTHLVSAFIVSGIVIFYLLIINVHASTRKRSIYSLASLSLGLGLTAYFILPVIFEMSYVQIDYINRSFFADYRNNFLLQLNTFSAEVLRLINPKSFIGLLNITVLLELLLFVTIGYFLYKRKNNFSNNRRLTFSIYMFILAFTMSTPLSSWLWDLLPPLKTIQFPWRWMAFMEVALIFLIAVLLKEVKDKQSFAEAGKYRSILYIVSALVTMSMLTIFIRNHELPEQMIGSLLYPEKYGYDTGLPREYTPVWATDLERRLMLPVPERVTILSGTASAKPVLWEPEKRIIKVNASSQAMLRIATFYYPGWIAESDGTRKQVLIEKKSGTMMINIQPGQHVITLKLLDTPLRRAAKYLSLFSLLLLILYYVRLKALNR